MYNWSLIFIFSWVLNFHPISGGFLREHQILFWKMKELELKLWFQAMELCTPIWEPQHICLHLNAPRALPSTAPPLVPREQFVPMYLYMSQIMLLGSYSLPWSRMTVLLSSYFFLYNFPLWILSIVRFCHCISFFGFCVITIILDLFYSLCVLIFLPPLEAGISQSQNFAPLDIYSFL